MKNIFKSLSLITITSLVLGACNKLPYGDVPAGTTPVSFSGVTLDSVLRADPNTSIFRAAVTKAGFDFVLRDADRNLTILVPDDAAFTASGVSLAVVQGVLTAQQLQGILLTHIIPQRVPTSKFSSTFPNSEFTSLLSPPPPSNVISSGPLNIPFNFKLFPSKRGSVNYVNNIPLNTATTDFDIAAKNGIMHKVQRLIMPPTKVLAQEIYADATLTYLTAAIARADSGQVGLAKFDEILKNGGANITVLAPNDVAFKALLTGLITQALVAQGLPLATASATATALAATPAVFSNPALYTAIPAATVRGLVAYHLIVPNNVYTPASQRTPTARVFTTNMPTTPTFYPTAVNGAIAVHPGVRLMGTFFGPFGIGGTATGLGNGGAASNIIAADINCVNGVVQKIDRVLLPQ